MISVIIPTLDEEKAVKEVIESFPKKCRGHNVEITVVDGGSTDGTVEIVRNSGAELIEQSLTGGKGDGVREAIERIEADIYVTIDGDGTYDPEELEKVVKPITDGEADHVIGKRVHREKGSIPKLNLLGNRFFNRFASFMTGTRIEDMLSGYRAFSNESLHHTAFTRPGFGIETEMTLTAIENNVKLIEVPISYNERKGKSKLNPVNDGLRILKSLLWSVRDIAPLRFFAGISLILALAASYPGYLTVMQKLQYGRIYNLGPALAASFLAIIAVQFLILGMLADQIKNVENRLRSRI